MKGHHEIQTRQKGAWLRWIGFRSGAPYSTIESSWSGHCASARRASRLVFIDDVTGRVRIIAARRKGAA